MKLDKGTKATLLLTAVAIAAVVWFAASNTSQTVSHRTMESAAWLWCMQSPINQYDQCKRQYMDGAKLGLLVTNAPEYVLEMYNEGDRCVAAGFDAFSELEGKCIVFDPEEERLYEQMD